MVENWVKIMMKHKTSNSANRRRGFTLTEVLLVLAILGVIMAMVIPNLLARQQDALKKSTKNNIMSLESIAKTYAIAHEGEWPRDIQALINPGQDKDGKPIAPYIEKVPKDAWNQPLYYEYPNSKGGATDRAAIWSSGQNKQNEEGGGDDINNWTD